LSNFMLGFYRLNLQYIAWFSGDMERVIMMSEAVIDVKYEFTSRLVIDCYVMKALALEALNKSDLASNTIKDAIEFAEYTKDPSNLIVALSGRARLKLIQGEIEFAADWVKKTELSEIAPTMLWCIEVPEITRCRVLIARGRKKDLANALDLLIKYRKFSESIYFIIQTIDIMMLQARVYKKLMQENKAHDTLKAAIEIAAEGEWIRPFAEQKGEISDLLLNLKEEGIHPDFIDMIFEANKKSIKLITKDSEAQESINKQKPKDSLPVLTKQELVVLRCIAEGLRNQEIAKKLFNSEETIKKHIYHMFQKLEVKNRLSLVAKAKTLGMLT
jgi:LuxR family maltose regulon positive regulatory protein